MHAPRRSTAPNMRLSRGKRIASRCCATSRRTSSSPRCAATSSCRSITRKRYGRCSATRASRPPKAATSTVASTTFNGSRRVSCERGGSTMAAKFDQNDDSVVVIIGSGAGGGTLANELAQKGIKVVLLEAGKRIEIEDFLNDEWDSFTQLAWKDM